MHLEITGAETKGDCYFLQLVMYASFRPYGAHALASIHSLRSCQDREIWWTLSTNTTDDVGKVTQCQLLGCQVLPTSGALQFQGILQGWAQKHEQTLQRNLVQTQGGSVKPAKNVKKSSLQNGAGA